LQPLQRHEWNFQDAMIGRLSVRDVRRSRSRHVTRRAVGLLDMMFGGECLFVARETFRAIESDALFRLGRRVRIVARHARHFVARLLLADAHPQRFALAESA
jgi:hypothetical protein